MVKKLTNFDLQALKPKLKAYKRSDMGGLFLEVLPTGTMVWRYQYLLNGKREKVTIGTYRQAGESKGRTLVGLDDARNRHNEYKKLVKNGTSPAELVRDNKRNAKLNERKGITFGEVVREWLSAEVAYKSAAWQYTVKNWLRKDILPCLEDISIFEIDENLIRTVVAAVEKRGAFSSAAKVQTICKQICSYAKRRGILPSNPLQFIDPVFQIKTQSHRPLMLQEIGPFFKSLQRDTGRKINKCAIRLLALTLTRKDELRLATWDEIDLHERIWTIPAHRMKMRTPHKVYLSRQAIAILEDLKEEGNGSNFVFPSHSTKFKPIGHTTLNSVIDRLSISGGRFVPHGFRATASTILNESGFFRGEAIERALAHQHRNKVRATYNQAEYAAERASLLQWWADYLDHLEAGELAQPGTFVTSLA